jgi:hypothetical protein
MGKQVPSDSRKRSLPGGETGLTDEGSLAELEAKRQRKLQVLRMLADDDSTAEIEQLNDRTTIPEASKNSADITASGIQQAVSSSALFKLGGGTKVKASSFRNLGEDADEKPVREIQRLDYTEDELQQIEAAAIASHTHSIVRRIFFLVSIPS